MAWRERIPDPWYLAVGASRIQGATRRLSLSLFCPALSSLPCSGQVQPSSTSRQQLVLAHGIFGGHHIANTMIQQGTSKVVRLCGLPGRGCEVSSAALAI